MSEAHPAMRIGHGYDLHRLEPLPPEGQGRPLRLAGIAIEHDRGPISHSDGDAVLHALTDAILGALGEPDIGELFPDASPKWKGAASEIFVAEALARMKRADYRLDNVDITVILEKPRLAAFKDAMRSSLASLLDVAIPQVNIKGKSHEKVDAVGEGRAMEVHVVVLLQRH